MSTEAVATDREHPAFPDVPDVGDLDDLGRPADRAADRRDDGADGRGGPTDDHDRPRTTVLDGVRRLEDRPLALAAVFGAAYFALQYVSLHYLLSIGFAAVWPPSGLSMATFLVVRRSSWRVLIPTLIVVNSIGNAMEGFSVALVVGFAIANCAEPVVGALLVRRLAPGAAALARPVDVGGFMLLAAALAPAASGSIAAAFICADGAGFAAYWNVFRSWFSSDALGVIVLTPVALTLTRPMLPLERRRLLQVAPSVAVLGLLTQLLLGRGADPGLTVLGLPIVTAALLWPSLFLGRRAVSLSIAVISTVIVVNTAGGGSAFALPEWTTETQITAIQLFIVTLALTHLIVASMMAQQRLHIAEVRRAAAELAARTDDLERSNQELSQFSYVVSHDLSAPLRSISGFAELLRSRYGDQLDDRGRSYAGHIVDGASRMKRLLDSMLEYARAESNPAEHQPVSLADVVVNVQQALREPMLDAGALLTVGELPVVLGDEGQLERLVQNLVSNSIKYRRPDLPPRIRIGVVDRADGLVSIEVADNGIGIDPDQRERVFQMFQRLHARDEHGGGEGIGLSVVKKIVESTGGSVRIGGRLGGGCSVVFSLPLAEGTQTSRKAGRS